MGRLNILLGIFVSVEDIAINLKYVWSNYACEHGFFLLPLCVFLSFSHHHCMVLSVIMHADLLSRNA